MSLIQIIVLALIQGLTEFLPVSSSAHLILGGKLMSWPDQGLVVDVAIHLGTLFAVIVYFRRDLVDILNAILKSGEGQGTNRHRQMGLNVLLASIPVIVAGAFLHEWVGTWMRDIRVVAGATLVFGLLLWVADSMFLSDRRQRDMSFRPALLIGCAQVLALIPGASRSGVTIMMGRMLGFSADAAARFSFLLAIPVLAAAGAYGLMQMMLGSVELEWRSFLLAIVFSSLAGFLCISVFLSLLRKVGLLPFILYRLALGVVLLWFAI